MRRLKGAERGGCKDRRELGPGELALGCRAAGVPAKRIDDLIGAIITARQFPGSAPMLIALGRLLTPDTQLRYSGTPPSTYGTNERTVWSLPNRPYLPMLEVMRLAGIEFIRRKGGRPATMPTML